VSKERSLDDLLIKQKKGNENDFDGIFEWMRPSFNVAVAFFPEFIQAAVALWTFYLDYGQYVNNEPDFQGILVGSDNRVSQELAIQMVLWLFEEVPVIQYERHGFQRYGIIQPTS